MIRNERRSGTRDRTVVAVIGVTVTAVLVRLYGLGTRVFHYDEAWVGYWVLKSAETGVWHYRPIVHGPFFARINPFVFDAVGPSDFAARLVVALVGGALPLTALLLRRRLDDSDVVALALLLAINPILLYYSRFMRFDLLLAAFALVTLGFLVRGLDTGLPRYAYAAAVTGALAFTTKESVLLYGLSWLGAGVLLLDDRFLRSWDHRRDWRDSIATTLDSVQSGARQWAGHLVAAGLLWLAIVVFFFAPRSSDPSALSLGRTLQDPVHLPALVGEATLGSFTQALGVWGGGMQGHPYLPYVTDTLATLREGAPLVVVFALVGFLVDRYDIDRNDAERSTALVAFAFYVGLANTLGFPLANFLPVPWSTIHAVVPLTIPAAVGLGALYRAFRTRIVELDRPARVRLGAVTVATFILAGWALLSDSALTIVVGLVTLLIGVVILVPAVQDRASLDVPRRQVIGVSVLTALVLAAGVHVGVVAFQTSYAAPTAGTSSPDGGSQLVYQSQPPNALRPTLSTIRRLSDGSGTDVQFVGSTLAMPDGAPDRPPGFGAWHARQPFPWYTEQFGTATESVTNVSNASTDVPVLITTPDHCRALATRLDDHLGIWLPLDQTASRAVCVFLADRHVESPTNYFVGRATAAPTAQNETDTDGS